MCRWCRTLTPVLHGRSCLRPGCVVDKSKTKVGYEIPMTRYFYEYQPPEPVDDIVERIQKLEREIADSLNTLFHKEG